MFEEQNEILQQDENPVAENINLEPPIATVPLSEEQKEKIEIKKSARVIGFSFLIMSAIILSFSFILLGIFTAIGFDYNKAVEILNEPAISQAQQIFFSLIVFTAPFVIVCKLCRYRISDLISFNKTEKGLFLPLFLIGISVCSFSNIASSVAGSIFESIGIDYNVNYGQNPNGFFGFLLSLIATVIVPSLVEEFACRGIVLGILRKFGNNFAILVSAILFGLMHSNFEQIPFAMLIGVALGFVTVKSGSIWCAVSIHAFNNLVSVVYSYILSSLSLNLQNISYTLFLIVTLVSGIVGVFLIKDKSFYVTEKAQTANGLWKKTGFFFTSVPIIIYTAFCIISSLQFFV